MPWSPYVVAGSQEAEGRQPEDGYLSDAIFRQTLISTLVSIEDQIKVINLRYELVHDTGIDETDL